jgi:hypothetical protein
MGVFMSDEIYRLMRAKYFKITNANKNNFDYFDTLEDFLNTISKRYIITKESLRIDGEIPGNFQYSNTLSDRFKSSAKLVYHDASDSFFKELKICFTEEMFKTDKENIVRLANDLFSLAHQKLNNPRSLSYFRREYVGNEQLFLDQAGRFSGLLTKFVIAERARNMHTGDDEGRLILINSKSGSNTVRHEFFHYFAERFPGLKLAIEESQYFRNKKELAYENKKNLGDSSKPYLDVLYDAGDAYSSNNRDLIDYYDLIGDQEVDPNYEEPKKNISDFGDYENIFISEMSEKIASSVSALMLASLEYAKDDNVRRDNNLETSQDVLEFAFKYADNYNKSKKGMRSRVVGIYLSRLRSRLRSGLVDTSNNFYDLDEMISIFKREYREIFENNILQLKANATERDFEPMYNTYLSWLNNNVPNFKENLQRLEREKYLYKKHNEYIKDRRELASEKTKDYYDSLGRPKNKDYYVLDSTFLELSIDKSRESYKKNILKALKKVYSVREYNQITDYGQKTPEEANKDVGYHSDDPKMHDLTSLTYYNVVKHMYDENHKSVSVRTLYDVADKYVLPGDPENYESYFLKLLNLELPDSHYNVEVIRAIVPLMNSPKHNALALSTYNEIAKVQNNRHRNKG